MSTKMIAEDEDPRYDAGGGPAGAATGATYPCPDSGGGKGSPDPTRNRGHTRRRIVANRRRGEERAEGRDDDREGERDQEGGEGAQEGRVRGARGTEDERPDRHRHDEEHWQDDVERALAEPSHPDGDGEQRESGEELVRRAEDAPRRSCSGRQEEGRDDERQRSRGEAVDRAAGEAKRQLLEEVASEASADVERVIDERREREESELQADGHGDAEGGREARDPGGEDGVCVGRSVGSQRCLAR